jgi:uncharacterized protein YjiS (DUF1127 family)
MKQATYTDFDMRGAQEYWPQAAKRSLAKVLDMPAVWSQRKADRTRLADLSPRLRDDVAMTEEQWSAEIIKPFWRK